MGVRFAAVAALFSILILNSPAQAAAVQTCGAAAMPDCEKLSLAPANASGQPSLSLPVSRDGGAVANSYPYFSAKTQAGRDAAARELTKIAVPNSARIKPAQKIIEAVRQSAITAVTNSVSRSALSAEQSALVKRLETVDIVTVGNENPLCRDLVPLGYPNASYDQSTHQLYVCPAVYNVTESQIVHTLSHEFGHVIGPCSETATLYTIDSDQNHRGPLADCNGKYFYDDNGEPLDGNDINPVVSMIMANESPFIQTVDKLSTTKELEACGILKPVAGTRFEKPALFAATFNCLAPQFNKDYELEVKKFAIIRAQSDKTSLAAGEAATRRDFPPYCASAAQEQFADRFESKVLGAYAAAKTWRPSDFRAAFLAYAGIACSDRTRKSFEGSAYPPSRVRVESMFSNIDTARLLNCQPSHETRLCPMSPEAGNSRTKAGEKATSAGSSRGAQ